MELTTNNTKTLCFFSLNTDLEKTYICIQYFLYLKKNYPDKNAIILYDGLDNSYYRQLFLANEINQVNAETLSAKQSVKLEDYLNYDFIIFDISQQNYNIYESFLYNSQVVVIVNNDLNSIHVKELELNRTINKEVIYTHDGIKLFPVTYCMVIINNLSFIGENSYKQYKELLLEVADDKYIQISGILNKIEDKEITEPVDDNSYETVFRDLDAIFNPTEVDEDDDFLYGEALHSSKYI